MAAVERDCTAGAPGGACLHACEPPPRSPDCAAHLCAVGSVCVRDVAYTSCLVFVRVLGAQQRAGVVGLQLQPHPTDLHVFCCMLCACALCALCVLVWGGTSLNELQETERSGALSAELERTKNRADLAFNEARDNMSQINTLQVGVPTLPPGTIQCARGRTPCTLVCALSGPRGCG